MGATTYVKCEPVLPGMSFCPQLSSETKNVKAAAKTHISGTIGHVGWIDKLYLVNVELLDAEENKRNFAQVGADFRQRIGMLNLFNPFLPDRYKSGEVYDLRLHDPEQYVLATVLYQLGVEQGPDYLDDKLKAWIHTRSGKGRQNVSVMWPGGAIPRTGHVTLTFRTRPAGKGPEAGANLTLRCEVARNLRFPGVGRWHAVPAKDVLQGQNVDEGRDFSQELELSEDNHLRLKLLDLHDQVN